MFSLAKFSHLANPRIGAHSTSEKYHEIGRLLIRNVDITYLVYFHKLATTIFLNIYSSNLKQGPKKYV